MSIKGTLETFNLLDLLQMLAFNQKVGTLVLDTAHGPRTAFVEGGSFGFVLGDPAPSKALARVLRRTGLVPAARLERGLAIAANSSRFLGDVLAELGVLDPERRNATWREALEESFFDLLQTPITRFEFVEGQRLAPNGVGGEAIQPLCPVDGVLLEMTRKIDEWGVLSREVGDGNEVFEICGDASAALTAAPDAAPAAARVLPLLDGRRTMASLVDASDCDRIAVGKVLSALLHGGAVRVVPTDALLARAEESLAAGSPCDAVPLLRRAIDRGEVPPATRVRLADALEACGDPQEAAAELDTFATSEEEANPSGAFDALRRSMGLRGGDGATAARACDLWLRCRARIPGRTAEAGDALKRLVQAASAGGRPLDAAERLAAFLDAGEAPAEDRLVLADLFAAGGRPADAAQALIRRAEDLLAQGRAAAARELLRRAVAYDGTRADARRRIADIEGLAQRRRHRRRLGLLLLLLALVAATAGGAYVLLDSHTARAVEAALQRGDAAANDADKEMQTAQAAWGRALATAASSTSLDASLGTAASAFRTDADRIGTALKSALRQVTEDMGGAGDPSRGDAGAMRLHDLEGRLHGITARLEGAFKDAAGRATRALAAGEKAFQEGRFREARPLLVQASNLSFDAPERASSAQRQLEHVESYLDAFTRARKDFDEAAAAGETDAAWRAGARLLARFLDSDVTRELMFPVPVASDPAGAEVRLGAGAAARTPTTLRYSPFGDLDLALRAPGRVPFALKLPSYKDVFEAERAGGSTPVRIDARLPEGPRWVATAPGGIAAGPFLAGDQVVVAVADGRRVLVVRANDGDLSDARAIGRRQERVRLAGRAPGGTWVLEGLRTFTFVPDSGEAGWQVRTVGRLDRPPAFSSGIALLVDETGACTGVALVDGSVRWRHPLSFGPLQPPLSTAIGFVVTTLGGEAVVIDSVTGETKGLVPADALKPVYLAPWGGSVLILGGGAPGLATLSASRERREIGPAAPDLSLRPTSAPEGVAWTEKDGSARWLSTTPEMRAARLDGLGQPASAICIAEGWAYAVGRDNVLRGVRLEAPGTTAWSVHLQSPARGEPIVRGDSILVAGETTIASFDR